MFFKKSKKEERHKRCCLHFKKKDIAAACNISIRKLQYICRNKQVDLSSISLSELVDFIVSNRKTIKTRDDSNKE